MLEEDVVTYGPRPINVINLTTTGTLLQEEDEEVVTLTPPPFDEDIDGPPPQEDRRSGRARRTPSIFNAFSEYIPAG